MLSISIDSSALTAALAKFPAIVDKSVNDTAIFAKKTLVKATPVRTGKARGGWTIVKEAVAKYFVINKVPHMRYLEEGIGEEGPKHIEITPIKAKALKIDIGGGQFIFRKSSVGFPPKKIVAKNLQKIQKHVQVDLHNALVAALGR